MTIARPEQEDLIRGLVQIDKYKGNDFELNGWNLTKVLDDILMVQYVDINEAGTEIKRGNIWLPINAVQHTWRIGVVLLAGPNCKTVKQGDHIVFPNDKGIQVANLNNLKNIVFLNEARVFGVCEADKTSLDTVEKVKLPKIKRKK
jgi:co-chaperonin GroES (HSP10)